MLSASTNLFPLKLTRFSGSDNSKRLTNFLFKLAKEVVDQRYRRVAFLTVRD